VPGVTLQTVKQCILGWRDDPTPENVPKDADLALYLYDRDSELTRCDPDHVYFSSDTKFPFPILSLILSHIDSVLL
jgi:hypothetical protein